jgi:hypothetical protein
MKTLVVKTQVEAPLKLAEREVSSDHAQLRHRNAWHRQEAPARTALAWPPATPIDCMPRGLVSTKLGAQEAGTCFTLACPILDIFNIAFTAEIDEFTGLYEHVTCRDDIGDRRITGIFPCEPDSNGYVIRNASECDRQQAMDTKE